MKIAALPTVKALRGIALADLDLPARAHNVLETRGGQPDERGQAGNAHVRHRRQRDDVWQKRIAENTENTFPVRFFPVRGIDKSEAEQ